MMSIEIRLLCHVLLYNFVKPQKITHFLFGAGCLDSKEPTLNIT